MTPMTLPPVTRSEKIGTILTIMFLTPFCIVSLVSAWFAFEAFLQGDLKKGAFLAIFSLAFGGASLRIAASLVSGRRLARQALALYAAHPDQPWLWRSDWAAGVARSATKNTMLFSWGFAILWNLISTPLLLFLPEELFEKGNTAALLGLLFPLVGIGLLVWAVRQTIELKKFGQSVFKMSSVPGVIGGTLEGTIAIPSHFDPGQDFDLTLSGINRRVSGAGKSQSTMETILWQDSSAGVKSFAQPEAMGAAIPVRFAIPSDCEQTDGTNPRNAILWRLEVHAAVPGVDYRASFEVPVFRTADSKINAGEASPAREVPAGYQPGPESGISVGVGPTGGIAYEVKPQGRGVSLVSMLAFFLIWTGAIALMVHVGAPFFFIAIFALFDLFFLYSIMQFAVGRCSIQCDADSVTIRNGVGPLSTSVTVRREEIARVAPSIAMQTGHSVRYAVTITTRSGKNIVARTVLKEKHDAAWLAEKMGGG
ncbi:MAG TPA: hypothetical protein VMM37_08240 [Bacteroidota bacterium]|nr:hypothetical protein [Bacteroidota bacterium]